MGVYSEYLDKNLTGDQLNAERKRMLVQISQLRGRDLLVYAADVTKAQQGAPVALIYDDLLPVQDQLENLKSQKGSRHAGIDVMLETGGGSGEVAEDIVRIIRSRYESVAFIVPGMAKSAGTIMVMSGDEILMDDNSALGPIDAQIQFEGKQFSAEALIKGFEKIKEESEATKSLNRAYIPLLQRISPGDLQHAQNALEFARKLVRDWLKQYKFQSWKVHRTHSPGAPVSEEQKEFRAAEIAQALCDHSRWLTHGRSIRMVDLLQLGVEVTDYSATPELAEAIKRYHVLLQMMFNGTNIYKIVETPTSQIIRFFQQTGFQVPFGPAPPVGLPGPSAQSADAIVVGLQCGKCQKPHQLQADFDNIKPLQPGNERFPVNDVFVCNGCGNQINLGAMRQQIELQMKRKIVRQ